MLPSLTSTTPRTSAMSTNLMQRTRFRYQAGDKVIVTLTGGQERTGVVEAQVQDPAKQPYLVRYDATLDDRRAKASRMADSFWRSLVLLVMRASAYDGVLHIGPDSYAGDCLSLLFRYEHSGFEGGLIFHGERTGPGGGRHALLGEWSLHS